MKPCAKRPAADDPRTVSKFRWKRRHQSCPGATQGRERVRRRHGGARQEAARPDVATRMLCTECLHVGEPDTLLDGSDRVELAAWCCFALPGLLYCGWRHLQRSKVCPECGSGALMRESRAAAARRAPQASPADGARVYSLSGLSFAWPQPLGSTRLRLRHGSVGALLLAFGASAWLLGVLDVAPEAEALQAASVGGLLSATWLARQIQRITRPRNGLEACEAWDEHGRALRIERI